MDTGRVRRAEPIIFSIRSLDVIVDNYFPIVEDLGGADRST